MPRSSGGGGAFTATMAIELLTGHDLEVINYYACRVAAFICSQAGAVPNLPSELLQFGVFCSQTISQRMKICVTRLGRQGIRVGRTKRHREDCVSQERAYRRRILPPF